MVAKLRRRQPVPIRGILPAAIAELRRWWRFTELPGSSAKLWRLRLGAGLPEFAAIWPVCFAQLLGAAQWRIVRTEILLSSEPELLCSAVVSEPARLQRKFAPLGWPLGRNLGLFGRPFGGRRRTPPVIAPASR